VVFPLPGVFDNGRRGGITVRLDVLLEATSAVERGVDGTSGVVDR